MKRLYIIGNGFDRFFELPTATKDFVKQLEKIPFESFESAEEVYLNYGVNWSDFELSLAEISIRNISEDIVTWPDYSSDHEYDREDVIIRVRDFSDGLNRARKIALQRMIAEAETILKKMSECGPQKYADYFDSRNDSILTFNYTSTIETLFEYPKDVFHLHGYYKNNDELVFGYGNPSESFERFKKKLNSEMNRKMINEIMTVQNDAIMSVQESKAHIEAIKYAYDQCWNDPYVDKEYQELVSFYESNRKEYQYEKLRSFLEQLGTIDEVVIMGHSLGEVDRRYFEIIEDVLKPTRWRTSVHNIDRIKHNLFSSYSFYSKMSYETMGYMFEHK